MQFAHRAFDLAVALDRDDDADILSAFIALGGHKDMSGHVERKLLVSTIKARTKAKLATRARAVLVYYTGEPVFDQMSPGTLCPFLASTLQATFSASTCMRRASSRVGGLWAAD